jgi:hypothetical protein
VTFACVILNKLALEFGIWNLEFGIMVSSGCFGDREDVFRVHGFYTSFLHFVLRTYPMRPSCPIVSSHVRTRNEKRVEIFFSA